MAQCCCLLDQCSSQASILWLKTTVENGKSDGEGVRDTSYRLWLPSFAMSENVKLVNLLVRPGYSGIWLAIYASYKWIIINPKGRKLSYANKHSTQQVGDRVGVASYTSQWRRHHCVSKHVREIRIPPDFYKSNCLYYTVLIIRDTIKHYDSVSNTLCQNLVLLGVLIAKIFQKDEWTNQSGRTVGLS